MLRADGAQSREGGSKRQRIGISHLPVCSVRPQSDAPTNEEVSNDLVKQIRKLRWIGMDEEAQKLQTELTQRETAAEDSVVATPGETD